MKTLIVNSRNNGKKLTNVILSEFKDLNKNSLYKALRKKDVKVNNARTSENKTVYMNDKIDIYISDDFFEKEVLFSKELIVYEDKNIIIINKPESIEVVGINSLTSKLIKYLEYTVYPCHRLDRNTSGLILFAKNEISLNILLDKFKNREIEKHYTCTVYGIPNKDSDILISYLFKDSKKSIVYISDTNKTGYQKIVTEYKIISKDKSTNTSILDITLHTGKTHQIRAHLAHIGHPIIGDGKYGINEINKQFNCKTQKLKSTTICFKFTTDSGILAYLNGLKFTI